MDIWICMCACVHAHMCMHAHAWNGCELKHACTQNPMSYTSRWPSHLPNHFLFSLLCPFLVGFGNQDTKTEENNLEANYARVSLYKKNLLINSHLVTLILAMPKTEQWLHNFFFQPKNIFRFSELEVLMKIGWCNKNFWLMLQKFLPNDTQFLPNDIQFLPYVKKISA